MLPLLLNLATSFWPGFADAASVEGLRPSREVREALHDLEPKLARCAHDAHDDADLFVDVELLAAGFVDRTAVLANTGFDETCVVDTLRSLHLADRGKEPVSHVVVRLASTENAAAPPGLFPRAIASALAPVRDDFARCVSRAHATGSVVLRFTANDDGSVADVDARDGTLKNDAARTCIASALASLHVDAGHAARVSYVLAYDGSAPAPIKRANALDQPTLFDVLGCASAFR
jgi:hypothetical protein